MAFFFSNPIASLCQAESENPTLSDLELQLAIAPSARFLGSFQAFLQSECEAGIVNASSGSKQFLRNLLTNEKELLKIINGARMERKVYATRLRDAWRLFEVLQSVWSEGQVSGEILLTEYYNDKLVGRASRTCTGLR